MYVVFRARICKRLWSPGIDFEESVPQAGNRFLGSLKGLQIRAQCARGGGGVMRLSWRVQDVLYCRSFTLCVSPDTGPTKLLDHPKTKNLEGRGPQTDK
jgi:hypothetical protein